MVIKHIILLLAILAIAHSFLTVDTNMNLLRDEFNRIRVFHGLNVVYKEFPYHPSRDKFDSNGSLVMEDFVNLKRWGFNSIRLYMAWEGF
jgi:endoglycosylceramidase